MAALSACGQFLALALHLGFVGIRPARRSALPARRRERPNGRLIVVLSQLFSSTLRRLVAMATGMIGRPERRASSDDAQARPRAACRAECRRSCRRCLPALERLFQGNQRRAPPLSRCRPSSRPPEPRTASMPNFSITMRIEFGVGAARHHRDEPALARIDGRRQQMLAVPEREDAGLVVASRALVSSADPVDGRIGDADEAQRLRRTATSAMPLTKRDCASGSRMRLQSAFAPARGASRWRATAGSRLRRGSIIHQVRPASLAVRLEQPVQMDDEVAHMGVVDAGLRLGLPGGLRRLVVRERCRRCRARRDRGTRCPARFFSSPPKTRCRSCLLPSSSAMVAVLTCCALPTV